MSAGAKLHTYADLMTYIVRDAVTWGGAYRIAVRSVSRRPTPGARKTARMVAGAHRASCSRRC